MSKTAGASVQKWALKAGSASQDFLAGAESTTKDQAAAAIAAEGLYAQGVQQAIAKKSFSAGLQKAGKGAWLDGIREKGASNYGTGVTAAKSAAKYAANSGKFDSARNAANSLPRGAKGSAANLQRVTAVVQALRAAKVGA